MTALSSGHGNVPHKMGGPVMLFLGILTAGQ
jgi:hypothetical protein